MDKLIEIFERGMKTVFTPATAARESPAASADDAALNEEDRRKSAALMRVNHCGEVCAQALYQGQAILRATAKQQNRCKRPPTKKLTTSHGPPSEFAPWADGRVF